MGGIYDVNLMSDGNFLIVGDRKTAKYEFAVKNRADVLFLRPSFLIEFHNKWINGDDVNFKIEIYKNGRLKVFGGMQICIGKVNDYNKEELIKLIESNGGFCHETLSATITHLITSNPSGKRCFYAKKWEIPICHPEWVFQSIRRNATLMEKYFDPFQYDEEIIGGDACQCWDAIESSENSIKIKSKNKRKRKRTIEDVEENFEFDDKQLSIVVPKEIPDIFKLKNKRKRKRTIEEDDDEDPELDDKSSSIVPKEISDKSKQIPDDDSICVESNQIADVNRGNRDETIIIPYSNETDITIRSKSKSNDILQNDNTINTIDSLFHDYILCFYGFDDKQMDILTKVVKSHQGKISTKENQLIATHIIINSNMKLADIPTIIPIGVIILTEWFIEKSLYNKEIIIDKWCEFQPYRNIDKFFKIKISITGFIGIEKLHLKKLIQNFLGVNLRNYLTKNEDILIINSKIQNNTNKKKINFAKKWNIPIVTEDWIFEILKIGKIPKLLNLKWAKFIPKGIIEVPLKHNLKKSIESISIIDNDINNNNNEGSFKKSIIPLIISPRKKRKSFGRLVGRAATSASGINSDCDESQNQLEKKHVIQRRTESPTLFINDDDFTRPPPSQDQEKGGVSYLEPQISIKQTLMNILGNSDTPRKINSIPGRLEINDDPITPVRQAMDSKNKYKGANSVARRTRQARKDILVISNHHKNININDD